MGKIKIIRNKGFLNKFRDISVYLNNRKIRHISDGSTIEFETEKNQNSVYLKLDWLKSNTLTLNFENEEIIILEVVNYKSKYKPLKIVLCFILLFASPFLSEFNLALKFIYFGLTLILVIDLIKFLLSVLGKSKRKYIELKRINNVA